MVNNKDDKPEKLVFPGYKNGAKTMEVNLYEVSEVFKRQDGESVLEVERLRREIAELRKENEKTKNKLTQVIAKVQELSEFCAKVPFPKQRDHPDAVKSTTPRDHAEPANTASRNHGDLNRSTTPRDQ